MEFGFVAKSNQTRQLREQQVYLTLLAEETKRGDGVTSTQRSESERKLDNSAYQCLDWSEAELGNQLARVAKESVIQGISHNKKVRYHFIC